MKKGGDDLIKAIRLVWDSLDSHLDTTQGMGELPECCQKSIGSCKFHAKCVKEYAFIIKVLCSYL